jgi:HK97 family phage major capsid protein
MPQATWAALANAVDKNDRYLLARDAFNNTIREIEGRPVVVVENGELTALTILVGDFSAMYHIAYPDLEVMASAEAGFAKNSVLVRAVCRHTNICTYAAAFKKIVAVAL